MRRMSGVGVFILLVVTMFTSPGFAQDFIDEYKNLMTLDEFLKSKDLTMGDVDLNYMCEVSDIFNPNTRSEDMQKRVCKIRTIDREKQVKKVVYETVKVPGEQLYYSKGRMKNQPVMWTTVTRKYIEKIPQERTTYDAILVFDDAEENVTKTQFKSYIPK